MELTTTIKKVASMLGATEVKDRTILLDDYGITITPNYRDNSKLTIYLKGPDIIRSTCYSSIGASLSKGPALIVKDIQRRLLIPENLAKIKKDLDEYRQRQKEKQLIDQAVNDIERQGMNITRIKGGTYTSPFPDQLKSSKPDERAYWQSIQFKVNYHKSFDLDIQGLQSKHLIKILRFINELEKPA